MNDLVYADKEVENIIRAKYPNAKITDASDGIHTERFELEIQDVLDDEFYPFAIRKGFAGACFTIALLLESLKIPESKIIKPKENKEKLEKWIKLAEEKNL